MDDLESAINLSPVTKVVFIQANQTYEETGNNIVIFRTLWSGLNANDMCSLGSCVLKASVDRVSVDTIGRYGGRHSADMLA